MNTELDDKLETLAFQFDESYYCSGAISQSFAEKFALLTELKDISPAEFEELGLDPETFRRWKKGIVDPSLGNLVAFCIHFELDINTFTELMRAGGYTMNFSKRRDCAYNFLIANCIGMTVEECNMLLKKIGLKDSELLLAKCKKKYPDRNKRNNNKIFSF